MTESIWVWIIFLSFVIFALMVDLGVFHRRAHILSFKEALFFSIFWVSISFLINFIILLLWGNQKALEFLTGYLIELSLSADNIFVFALIFNYFNVPKENRHRVLFWGILGAIFMRLFFILTGVALLKKFHFFIYVLGIIVIVSGINLVRRKKEEIHPEKNPVLIFFKKFFPFTTNYHGQKFFVRINSKFMLTPLFIVLVAIETTDIVFAVDSVPAILAITRDAFIVFTSNICAILGLRSFYFLLENLMNLFLYLDKGLAIILIFIGIKMLISEFYKIHTGIALLFVLFIIFISIFLSLIKGKNSEKSL
ncbi:MAG: TerC/Alx family metal homeostasis membrane protein [candidate division WOR-3 bacterium]